PTSLPDALPICWLTDLPCCVFFTVPPSSVSYLLSLHDALPISWPPGATTRTPARRRRSHCSATRRTRSARRRHEHPPRPPHPGPDRKSTRLNSSHVKISYAVFCLKKKKLETPYTDREMTHLICR